MSDAIVVSCLSCEGGQQIGVLTLNRPSSLNAINQPMIDCLYEQLLAWQHDERIACIILKGEGDKSFCAGGDVRQLFTALTEDLKVGQKEAEQFFSHEYRLDYLIHTYSKPVVVWGHGIVMGGGLGLMVGGSHRVVTETTRMAMPEMAIGLYPDVGGSWFLNRMPGKTGLFCGITGCALNAGDALYAGLADRFLQHSMQQEVIDALRLSNWEKDPEANHAIVSKILRRFAKAAEPLLPESNLQQHSKQIQRLMDHDNLVEIYHDWLHYESTGNWDSTDSWLEKAIKGFLHGCPTTAYLVWEQIKRGRHLSLPEVFQMELTLSVQCCLHGDLVEGVRSRLVDKDNNPKWRYTTVLDVPKDWVETHFESLWPTDQHPLASLA
ncbi:enoyl-CoA hydratase/isomerase family protein [Zooshikella ganghwensis]|uniref:3-hydroxyisobutyryl-CoA hydrolase n=1 Tax=Zooshikella ganghwensis TaxID=202772 RepID=A0A4P9VSU3_9GAMM|nr:enoyl-CoA hydratase/isomerase family protein [Zooshikella ganghwensis]RDH45080.1 enoyl-CoA hydratase/isomerase family protein [Zooshikella ganghwensis]